jgi:hypothetical protein
MWHRAGAGERVGAGAHDADVVAAADDDESLAVRRLTGGLLVAVPVAFTAIFVALGAVFDYPDVLSAPTDEVLREFADGGDGLVALWYGFMLTGVGFVPIAVLLPRVLRIGGALGATSVVFGVLAGVLQFVGLARWPFLVPSLADTYLDPQASAATREATAVTFQAFHDYVGGALGEHFGYLFTAGWTLLIASTLTRVMGKPWLAALGAVSGLGVAAGMLERLVEAAGTVNAVAYAAWAVWLVIVGVLLLRAPARGATPPSTRLGRRRRPSAGGG